MLKVDLCIEVVALIKITVVLLSKMIVPENIGA